MTLRTRLLLAQAPLAAGLVLVGVVALTTLQTLGESSQLILRDNFRSVLAAQRMKEAAERVDSAALFRAAGRLDRADEQAPPNVAAFESQLRVQERNITEPGEAEATQRLRAAWNEYVAKYEAYRRIRDASELRHRYFDEMQPAFVRVKNAAERVLEINQDAMLLKSEQARTTAERSRSVLLLASVLALGLALLASVSLTRRVACGVDAERLSTRAVDDALLSTILSPLELARLGTLARNEATAAFHRLWTRKEAVLKALGLGLKVDPRCVLVGDEDELAFVNDPAVEPRSRTGWQVRTFQPTPDHVVSVAIGSVAEALRPLLIELEPTFEAARRLD